MSSSMSEERDDQVQEAARRVLPPVRLAVLLLLGALFLVVGGSRADAAEAEPASDERSGLLAGTLAAVDAGPELTRVGATVDAVVAPVTEATEPVVAPVVRPVVEPVVAPLRPVVERVAAPLAPLPVAELVAPVAAPAIGSDGPVAPLSDTTVETAVEASVARQAVAADVSETSAQATPQALADAASEAPEPGGPVSRSTASATDGGTTTPVPYAVLLTAVAAALVLAGGVAPRRVAPPLAPSFLPPVFPG